MLFTLVEFAADFGFWSLGKAYYIGKWMIYGKEKDPREQYIEEQRQIIEAYKKQLEQLRRETEILQGFVKIEIETSTNTEKEIEGE